MPKFLSSLPQIISPRATRGLQTAKLNPNQSQNPINTRLYTRNFPKHIINLQQWARRAYNLVSFFSFIELVNLFVGFDDGNGVWFRDFIKAIMRYGD